MRKKHNSQQQSAMLLRYLQKQLQQSQQLILQQQKEAEDDQQQLLPILTKYREYCEIKIYNFCTNNMHEYFQNIWEHLNEQNNNQYELIIPEQVNRRIDSVYNDLFEGKASIESREYMTPFDYDKVYELNSLKKKEENLKQKISRINQELSNSNVNQNTTNKESKKFYESLYSEQKLKAADEYAKKKRQEQIRRKNKLLEIQRKQEEAYKKKLQEIKEQEEKSLQKRKQQVIQKQNLNHQKRDQQRMLREQRKTEYIRIKKSLQEKPPLFQQIQNKYSKRYEQVEAQKRKRAISQRKQFLDQVDPKEIQKHEKQYEDMLKKRQKERKQRVLLMSQEQKSRMRYHSSFQLPPKQLDPRQIQKEKAKEKRQKIIQYRSIVREKFKPKIDANKRKQLMNIIQEMQLNQKRVKKTRLDNGTIMIEQLRQVDPKMIGIQYLQMAKEMASKARAQRLQSGDKINSNKNQQEQVQKPINYLEQIRKNRTRSEKLSFVDKKNMSYDDKVKKVLLQSEKLAQLTKQNQMMLKYGKFKTSQEILACKDQIDQNYIDAVNMKLKLILSQNQNENES